jgi:hypothetical protein
MAEPSAAIRWGRRFMYIFNLGIPVFLAYTASQGYMSIENYDDKSTSIVFQSTYLIFFAALLFFFEVVQIFPCEVVDNVLKRNIGFMYGGITFCCLECLSIHFKLSNLKKTSLLNYYIIHLFFCRSRIVIKSTMSIHSITFTFYRVWQRVLYNYDWNFCFWFR